MLRLPLTIQLDVAIRAAYVAYSPFARGNVVRTGRLSDDVLADYAARDELVGIELLALDAEAIRVAASFAKAQGLEFPRRLAEALVMR